MHAMKCTLWNLFKVLCDIPKMKVFVNLGSVTVEAYFASDSKMFTWPRNVDHLESAEPSIWRELFAIIFTLKSCSELVRNLSVHSKTNNFATSL